MDDYQKFINQKVHLAGEFGFDPLFMPDKLFDFQKSLVEWACRKGRAAIFADCVAAGTMVETERGPMPIESIEKPTRVWCRSNDGNATLAWSSPSWINGYAAIYEYTCLSGRKILATSGHRFMTDAGWKRGDELFFGEQLLISCACHQQTISESDLSIPCEDAMNFSRIVQDLKDDCSPYSHQDDEQPLNAIENDRVFFPLQDDAREHIRQNLHSDDSYYESTHNHHCQSAVLLSKLDCDRQDETIVGVAECRPLSCGRIRIDESNHISQQNRVSTIPLQTISEFHPSAISQSAGVQSEPLFFSFDTLVSIKYIRNDFFYDINVPIFSNYIADGFVSHNCGLGKTPMQLAWAENVVRKTNGRVLILTPLAVAFQTVKEGEKFGIEATHRREGIETGDKIVVTNYERLHYFNPEDFAGVVCDESSILKHYTGATQKGVTRFMCKTPYRLLCTATAAPNDYIELGTSSEALGELSHSEMLSRFFCYRDDKAQKKEMREQDYAEKTCYYGKLSFRVAQTIGQWRLKNHAIKPFWRWVASWARACRMPSDLGFDNDGFILPKLTEREHIITPDEIPDGYLFALPAVGLGEEREERKRTIRQRCEYVAGLARHKKPVVVWCHTNAEGDLLEELIDHSIQIAGRHSDEYKEAAAQWFIGTKCICNSEMFSVKLATWTENLNDRTDIGRDTIKSIVTNALKHRKNMEDFIEKIKKYTSKNTIEKTKKNIKEQKSNKKSTCEEEKIDTIPIQNLEQNKSRRHLNTEKENLISESQESCENMDHLLMNICDWKNWVALSAEIKNQVIEEVTDFISTMTIPLENSEDYYALNVILGSENFMTILSLLKRQHCICGHISGNRKLISKSRIFGFGLNFQHCSHVITFASHSYEQYYQSVRRCWRFGQKKPVTVDVVATEGESRVMKNMQRKAKQADRMFSILVAEMNNSETIKEVEKYTTKEELPSWL